MARLSVNPTRMELTRLKARLRVAVRGHKLLKDKNDELVKRFLGHIKKNRDLRVEVERMMMESHSGFLAARAVMPSEAFEEALMLPKRGALLDVSGQNIMGVSVPVFEFKREDMKPSDIYPYGFAATSGELDRAVRALSDMLPHMLRLAESEKSAQLLAREIEKTRRRVNALEHIIIPNYRETIKYIGMKLEENERGARVRLMKVKDAMLRQAGYGQS